MIFMLKFDLAGGHQMAKMKEKNLEEQYKLLLKKDKHYYEKKQDDDQSLEQPSPLKNIPSVTTYGAYEEPILES